MENIMNAFLGNSDMMKAFDFSQQPDWLQGMNASALSLQILEFQKSAFKNSYDMLMKIQEQSEKITDMFLSNTMIPDQSKDFLYQWRAALRKGQVEMKKSIDSNFSKAEAFLSDQAKSAKAKKK